MPRQWLDVPFAEKDEAKSGGARWDADKRQWYAPREGMKSLQKWAGKPALGDLLPGEDRSFGDGLFVDLVPKTCWFTNVRSCVSMADWDRLRRMITTRAGRKCEACGAEEDRETRRWLEAHERWLFDDVSRTQKLVRLICLCTDCHQTTHFGFAQLQGKGDFAFDHLRRVEGLSKQEATTHINEAFGLWEERSAHVYELDLSILLDADIEVEEPPAPSERDDEARRETSLRTIGFDDALEKMFGGTF